MTCRVSKTGRKMLLMEFQVTRRLCPVCGAVRVVREGAGSVRVSAGAPRVSGPDPQVDGCCRLPVGSKMRSGFSPTLFFHCQIFWVTFHLF